MKIILVFDSFKGSLTASEAVEAATIGIREVCPDAEIIALPLADGGEGTVNAFSQFHNVGWRKCIVHNPLFRKIEANYALIADRRMAVMEMSAAAGLTLISEEERNPMRTTTFGLGEMILDAISLGYKDILIGIGGSATCDCGIGMLSALGVRFLDRNNKTVSPVGSNLIEIEKIDWSGLVLPSDIKIEVACDVNNPLYGMNGAAYVYAPQKGATAEEVKLLDDGLRNFARLTIDRISTDIPGSGAAGGLGYALLLLGAKLHRGIDLLLDTVHFDQLLDNTDVVITGEGKIDKQTLNGKLPHGILLRTLPKKVPTIAIAGQVENKELLLQAGFADAVSIKPENQSLMKALEKETATQNLIDKTRTTIINFIKTNYEDNYL